MNENGTFRFSSLGEAWIHCLAKVLREGSYTEDDDQLLLEVLGLGVVIEDLTADQVISTLADNDRLELMTSKYASLEPVPPYTRSYGALFYNLEGVDQIAKVVHRLNAKRSTKSATITFHSPGDSELSCITALDFKIRHEVLHTTVLYRSQNIYASQPGNMVALGAIVNRVAAETGSGVGPVTLNIASAHIYENDLAAAWSVLARHEEGSSGTKPSERRDPEIHRIDQPSIDDIAREWDGVSAGRHEVILRGQDLSYDHILVPGIMGLIDTFLNSRATSPGARVRILDAGCGTGLMSRKLASIEAVAEVVGIDPSHESIAIALDAPSIEGVCYVAETVETYLEGSKQVFDVVVANMLFQNAPELPRLLESLSSAIAPGGVLVFAVPHPCFWPRYWGYDREPWFSYWEENWISAPFRTSLARQRLSTTHAHRPLSTYLDEFKRVDLATETLHEPLPPSDLELSYAYSWRFPRFLLGSLKVNRG